MERKLRSKIPRHNAIDFFSLARVTNVSTIKEARIFFLDNGKKRESSNAKKLAPDISEKVLS